MKYSIIKMISFVIAVVVLVIVILNYIDKTGLETDNVLSGNEVTQGEETELSAEENAKIINKLSKIIILPTEEEPVVAVITDIELLLQEQSFYQGAENGDYLIIYPQTARAIIYSLDKNMIVNVGPVEFNNDQNAENTTDISDAGNNTIDQADQSEVDMADSVEPTQVEEE